MDDQISVFSKIFYHWVKWHSLFDDFWDHEYYKYEFGLIIPKFLIKNSDILFNFDWKLNISLTLMATNFYLLGNFIYFFILLDRHLSLFYQGDVFKKIRKLKKITIWELKVKIH